MEGRKSFQQSRKYSPLWGEFQREMAENLYQAKVAQAYESALYGGGVTGTPTLYLNGVRQSRLQTLHDLVEAVTEAGASLQESGTERHRLLERLRQFRMRRTQLKVGDGG